MLPRVAPNPPTVRETFALALGALATRLWAHLGFAAALITTSCFSCLCLGAVIAETSVGAPPIRDPLEVGLRIAVATLSVTAFALHRGFTSVIVLTAIRAAPIRFFDALRAAGDRCGAQVGVELMRVVLENLPGLIPAVLLFGDDSGAARSLGFHFPDAEWLVPAMFVVATLAYYVWSTLVRTAIGPAPAVVQAEPGGFVAAIRRSASIAKENRGAYGRLRAVFGIVAVALCSSTMVPAVIFMGSLRGPGSGAGLDATKVAAGVLFSALFYGFVYLLIALDTALDTAFFVRVTPTESEDVAKVFA